VDRAAYSWPLVRAIFENSKSSPFYLLPLLLCANSLSKELFQIFQNINCTSCYTSKFSHILFPDAMASQAPPSVPPRPVRSKSPLPPTPAIPPRPAARSAKSSDNGLPSPSPSPSPDPEPVPKTIPSSTELHAPVALSSRPHALPKTDSEKAASEQVSVPPTPTHTKVVAEEKEGIPQIGRRVPMYPNAGDVQAPTPSETPSGGKKKHVYREEWEMEHGAYGSGRRETPYSMLCPSLLLRFSFSFLFFLLHLFPFYLTSPP
jgi:hypothetical protein